MLTNSQIATLKANIQAPGNSAALSTFISTGNDAAITNYYNAPSSGLTSTALTADSYNVMMWAASGTVFSNIYNASVALVSGNSPVQSAALGMIQVLQPGLTLTVGDTYITQLVLTLKNAGVIKVSDLLALQATLQKSPASSGEALFGTNTVIDNGDVSQALRGYR